jgi:hypothetical protein
MRHNHVARFIVNRELKLVFAIERDKGFISDKAERLAQNEFLNEEGIYENKPLSIGVGDICTGRLR